MTLDCPEVREMLPGYSDDPDTGLAIRRHLSGCADCRAELARYESLAKGLRGLDSLVGEPPAWLVHGLQEIPGEQGTVRVLTTHLARNRRSYVGGAALLVAGAAGVAVWRSRRRLAAA